jgi:hypothetical protein
MPAQYTYVELYSTYEDDSRIKNKYAACIFETFYLSTETISRPPISRETIPLAEKPTRPGLWQSFCVKTLQWRLGNSGPQRNGRSRTGHSLGMAAVRGLVWSLARIDVWRIYRSLEGWSPTGVGLSRIGPSWIGILRRLVFTFKRFSHLKMRGFNLNPHSLFYTLFSQALGSILIPEVWCGPLAVKCQLKDFIIFLSEPWTSSITLEHLPIQLFCF